MFKKFKDAVARQFDSMKGLPLYRTNVEKELLWLTYIESFPGGTNPVYKERTEYDCQSCRSFVRAIGSVVSVENWELKSVWDCDVEEPYLTVSKALSAIVKSAPIKNILLHESKHAGVDKNYQDTGSEVLTWEHFYLTLPSRCVNATNRGAVYGETGTTRDLFRRGLEEITRDSIETVVELIEQGSLYRGEEHLALVKAFLELQQEYEQIDTATKKDFFCWRQDVPPGVARIKNSAIGTLLADLSGGKTLDDAVRMFESKVAPQNYKRPKAVVTKSMVERARKTVDELGYSSALGRRFAVAEDITVNNVLFANRDARKAMNADVFDELISETRDDPKSLEKVEAVDIETFVSTILPKASSVELLLENRHAGNLVNLVAPKDPSSKLMFKWANNFSWAYQGDLADSIKERVKARGGSVTGDFRASLAWFNSDDLDLHLLEPRVNRPRRGEYGEHIYYGNKRADYSHGELDVDMNVNRSGPNASRNAVENITYPKRSRMIEGQYHLYVNNFTHRERIDVGFEVELEFDGETITFAHDREVRQKGNVTVAKFEYTHKDGLKIIESLPRQDASKVLWGLQTQTYHPVTMVMLSPNHWDDRPTGNKHYLFMLQGCQREGSSRGFFNEYLKSDLHEHRKVFELIGSKMRTEEEGEQLSGLGFSSTQQNNVYAKVQGAFTRTVKVVF